MSDDAIEGSCVCGAVRYAIRAPFLGFQYCHCSRCQKATGSAHGANLFVSTERFEWTEGESHMRRFELPGAKYWCNGFCERCGSSLPWLTRTGKAFVVPTGTLDGDPGVRPTKNIYYGSRSPWFEPVPELETFEEMPPGW